MSKEYIKIPSNFNTVIDQSMDSSKFYKYFWPLDLGSHRVWITENTEEL